MNSASQSAKPIEPESLGGPDKEAAVAVAHMCSTCGQTALRPPVERYGAYELFTCEACGLQFWEPRMMPNARWYEQMYGGRDEKLLLLEPGHK